MVKILIVDDEPEIRFLTRKMLEKAGYEVVEAGDGEEGLRLLEKETPDLILLDVMMPGLKGWEVCGKIKANVRLKNIPVAMFTVRTTEEDVEKSRDCGAEAHINKPFDREELIYTVEKLLKKS
ncbi:response regulator [Candidatus Pyrohabitans sp.]